VKIQEALNIGVDMALTNKKERPSSELHPNVLVISANVKPVYYAQALSAEGALHAAQAVIVQEKVTPGVVVFTCEAFVKSVTDPAKLDDEMPKERGDYRKRSDVDPDIRSMLMVVAANPLGQIDFRGLEMVLTENATIEFKESHGEAFTTGRMADAVKDLAARRPLSDDVAMWQDETAATFVRRMA
jgi:hypothetical protein